MFSHLRLPALVVIFVICAISLSHLLFAEDGIPDNCEYTSAPHYRANIFSRYEPQNRRLVLVDWTTGEAVQEIGTNLADTFILGWSADCRYLATAIGSVESMDTVVWDTTNNTRIGAVPDARGKPHTITWGPHNFLMVETRNGAILWNIPANIQMTVTQSFDAYSARNFTRLRWDAENMQVTGNMAVGGREVYDMNTGQQTIAVNINSAETQRGDYYPGRETGEIVIGGKAYVCQSSTNNYYYSPSPTNNASEVRGVYVDYMADIDAVALYVKPVEVSGYTETIQMVEDGLDVRWFEERGWSENCRYFAASVGVVGKDDISDLIVWDVVENRRVSAFTGAYLIQHPITWSETGDALVVESRDGAYLWYLPTDTRSLITTEVETALAGCSYIRSFYKIAWDAARGHLLAVEVGANHAVRVYDIPTGQRLAEYAAPWGDVDFLLSPDGRRLALFAARRENRLLIVDRQTNQQVMLDQSIESPRYIPEFIFSPDSRHFVRNDFAQVLVWDMDNINMDSTPNRRFEDTHYRMYFVDNETLQDGSGTFRINIITGETQTITGMPLSPANTSAVTGVSGYSVVYNYYYERRCPDIRAEYDKDNRQIILRDAESLELIQVVESGLNQTTDLRFSSDCRYLSAFVYQQSNENLPYDTDPIEDNYVFKRSGSVMIWDVATGERLLTLDNPYRSGRLGGVGWSPANEWALVRTSQGTYVFNPGTRHASLLTFTGTNTGLTTTLSAYWDFDRGQVLVRGWVGIHAFDLQTGVERSRFTSTDGAGYCNYWHGCGFSVNRQQALLLVYGSGSIGVWNLDTLQHTFVDVDPSGSNAGTVEAVSPDWRYLVLARGMVRVWDLTTLPEEFRDRDPVYSWHGPDELVRGIKFIDNVTVELSTSRFVGKTYHMNVETGEYWLVED